MGLKLVNHQFVGGRMADGHEKALAGDFGDLAGLHVFGTHTFDAQGSVVPITSSMV